MSLFETLEQVNDRESFLTFIRSLSKDCAENPDEWQNGTIGDYLESISAWMESCDQKEFAQMDFKEAAKLLYVGKIYE